MKRVAALAIVALLIAIPANSQTMHGVTTSNTGGGAAVAPTCTNSLDFTQACNSQYMSVM